MGEIKDIQDNLETTSQKDASEKLLLNEGDTETETKKETEDLKDDVITTLQTDIKDTVTDVKEDTQNLKDDVVTTSQKEIKDTVIEKEIKDIVIEKEMNTVKETKKKL